jgi:hypothetical protein
MCFCICGGVFIRALYKFPQWRITTHCEIVGPVDDCQTLLYITGSVFVVALASTSLLFFFRVRGVYGNSKITTAVFGFLWVATLGVSFLVPTSITGTVRHSLPV